MAKLIEIDYEPGPFNDGLPDATAARGASAPAPAPKLVPVDYEPEPYEGGLPPPSKGVVLPSLKRAAGQMVESAGTTLEDITGPNAVTRSLRDFGGGVVRDNPSQIQSFGDVLDKPWTTVKEAVAEQLPQLGAAYAGAKAGATVGGMLGPAGAAVGGVIGGLAPIAVQEYGEIRGKQEETGEENIPLAIGGATAATALERLGLEKLATKAGAKGFGEVLEPLPQGASRLAHAGKQALKTALVEGPGTEIPQTAIERFAGGQEIDTPEAFDEYGVAGAKGAVGGGAIGGGLGLVAPREMGLPAPATTEEQPATGSPPPNPPPSQGGGPVSYSPPLEGGVGGGPDVGLADLDPEQRRHMMAIRGQEGPLTAAAGAGGLPSSTPASARSRATAGRRSVMTSDGARESIEEVISRIENSGRTLRLRQDEMATRQIAQQGYVGFGSREDAGEFQLLHPDYKWQKYDNGEIRFFPPTQSEPAQQPATAGGLPVGVDVGTSAEQIRRQRRQGAGTDREIDLAGLPAWMAPARGSTQASVGADPRVRPAEGTLPTRRSRGSLSPLGAQQAERARADIAAEQVRTAELAARGPLGRAVALGAESASLPGAVSFGAPPSMAASTPRATPTATGSGPLGASAAVAQARATSPASLPAPAESNASAPHGLNAPRTEAAARKFVTGLGARFPDERFEVVPHAKAPKRFAVRHVPTTTTTPEGPLNERLSPPRQEPRQAEGRGRDGALPPHAEPGQGPDGRAQDQGEEEAAGREAAGREGQAPTALELPALDRAASEAATSPTNDLPQPSEPQKEAGNYQKGHVRYAGLDISIENPRGSKRSGVDPKGNPWEVEMSAHYGYVRRSEGADGEQVDVYLASDREDTPVFVVDQANPKTNRFDEHKVVLGAASRAEAEATYDAHFSDGSGPERRKDTTGMSMDEFKAWLKDGDTKKAIAKRKPAPATAATPATSNTPTDTPTSPAGASPGPSQEVGLPARTPKASLLEERRDGRRSGLGDAGGKPFASDQLYQGRGATQIAVYGAEAVAQGRAVPILGQADYYAFSEADAKRYGQVKKHQVKLAHAKVITTNREWLDLVDEAKVPHLSSVSEEHYREPEQIPAATKRLQEHLRKQGYDGLVVRMVGDQKRLRETFRHDQVIVFPKTDGPASPLQERRDGRSAEGDGAVAGTRSATPVRTPPTDPPDPSENSLAVRLRDPELRAALQYMATQAGWAQRGGELLRDEKDKVIGRTTWIPNELWYAELPERLDRAATVEAVKKAIAGEKLGAKEQRIVGYMLDAHDRILEEQEAAPVESEEDRETRLEREAIMEEANDALAPLSDEDIRALLGAEWTPFDWKVRTRSDENVRQLFEGRAPQGGRGADETEPRAPPKGDRATREEAGPPLLETYRAEDLARREEANLKAEREQAEQNAAAQAKRKADRDREGFVLTGSDNVADELEARGQGSLLDQAAEPVPSVPSPAAPTPITDEEARALFDEAQALMRKLPTNVGKAKQEGRLSAAQQKHLARLDEIEKRLPSTSAKWQAIWKERRAESVAKDQANVQSYAEAQIEKLKDIGLAVGDEVSMQAASMLPNVPGQLHQGTVKQGKRGNVYIHTNHGNFDVFRNPWRKVEPPAPAPAPSGEGKAPLRIQDLTEKSIIVLGDTKTHKDRIKALRGLWNAKRGGWVFPKKREAQVRAGLEDLLEAQPAPGDLRGPADSGVDSTARTQERRTAEEGVEGQAPRSAKDHITYQGRTISVTSPKRLGYNKIVLVDAAKFDAAWAKDKGFYVGPGGTGAAIEGRYQEFEKFIATHDSIKASPVDVDAQGRVSFGDGRHRLAVLRDAGLKTLPVAMSKASIKNAENAGMLAGEGKTAWWPEVYREIYDIAFRLRELGENDRATSITGGLLEAKAPIGFRDEARAREALAVYKKDLATAERKAENAATVGQIKPGDGAVKVPPLLHGPSSPKELPSEATAESAAPASSPAISLAHALRDRILEKPLERINALQLFAMATKAYGGTAAEGKFVSKDAYDALELGLNLARLKRPPINRAGRSPALGRYRTNLQEEDASRATQLIDSFEQSQNRLPTPSKRSGEQVELQQFSTPHTHAHVMAWVANLGPGDTVLEPSAGTGNIVTQALLYGPKSVHANEISPRRAELVSELGVPVSRENAAHIDALLPGLTPTVVLMNPPFSANMLMKGKKATETGAAHVAAALKKLAPGGRLVALLGRGMGFTETGQPLPRFREWWAKVQTEYNVRAVYGISGREYRKFGTEFDTALVVIDKPAPGSEEGTGPRAGPMAYGSVEKVSDLPALLEGIRNDRTTELGDRNLVRPDRAAGEPPPVEPGSPESTRGAGGGQAFARDAVRLPVDRVVPAEARTGAGERLRRHAEPSRTGEPSLGTHAGNGVPRAERLRSGREASAERPGAGKSGADGAGDASNLRAQGQDDGNRGGLSDEGLRRDAISRSVEDDSRSAQALDPAAIFEQYRPRIAIRGAKPHPAILAESAAMASVKAPESTYLPDLPKRVIEDGRLSDAQLVNVIQAGQSHGELLPNGERRGYFIGDGTGVGKGAQIAGVILDNWNQGRKRAVWVSENGKLFNDAGRDIAWVGMDKGWLHLHNTIKGDIALQEGVLFTTYDTLKGEIGGDPHPALPLLKGEGKEEVTTLPLTKGEGRVGVKRLDQIVKWLGEDFDGVIAFDEAHNLGNSLDEKGDRGVKKAAAKALAGIELQKRLPRARVLYVSATGATSVENLAYTDRLGLWGEGTAFASKRDFIDKIKSGGVATMEVVAKDMKAMGLYEARNLAFAGVVQRELLHSLTPDQTETYNEIARAWQLVLDNVNAALKITGAEKNSRAKSNALSQFWGSQQRFFNQVLTSLSVPTLIRDTEASLKAGRSVVMQLVNTNEAVQERRLAQAAEQEIDIGDIDINPRDVLMQYVQNAFPTQLYETQLDEDGNEINVPVKDSAGNPVEDPEAVRRRDVLLEKLASLAVPEGVLEQVINHFGTKQVAEITGRSRRVVRHKDGSTEIEPLSPAKSNKDADAFMQGKKRILIFSDAGGTGRSYHADLKAKNQEKRVHYLVQPGWRADKAVQGLGRTHRTNQAHPPEYVLVTTNLKAQRRFMSSIARRLDQLGALTKGQRDTASQGLFSAEMNLENQYGQWALRSLIMDILGGRVPGITTKTLEQEMGLYLTDPKTGEVGENKLPTVPRFLNRMLALESESMDRVFDAFYERLEAGIDYARQQGTLDVGMETITAQSVEKLSDQVIAGGQGKAETRYVKLALTDPVRFVQFDQLPWTYHPEIARNRKSGKLYAFVEAPTLTDPKTGELVQRLRRLGVRDQKYLPKRELDGDAYEMLGDLPRHELRAAWDAEIAKSPQTKTTEMHLVTGALLPIWDRLPTDTPKVLRTETDEGERLLGREIPPSDLSATLKALGAQGESPDLSPVQMAQSIQRDDATLVLANGWKIGTRVVSGEDRIEVMGPTGGDISILKDQGAFTEIIAFRNRVFIPTGSAAGIIERITQSKPVVEVLYPKGAADSGVRYSYLGEQAAKVPQYALAAARAYVQEGIPMEDIRKVTGWFRAKDDKWRFQISDEASTFRPGYRKGKTVGEVLQHGALFDNYPSLANIGIVWRSDLPEKVLGGYSHVENAFHLNGTRTLQEIRSTLLHELQHAVQVIEGFARGGSPHDEAFMSAVAAMGVDVNDRDAVFGAYQRLLGEVEARDVQARADLTAEELRERPPYLSQGIPESDFIVRREGELAAEERGPPGDTPSGSPFVRGRAEQKPGLAGLSASELRETLAKRFGGGVGRLIEAKTLRIVQHESEVPRRLNDGKGGIRGVYDPRTDKVWMVADNLTAADAPGVFLHEVGVHFGLERMVGSEKYEDIIRQLKAMERLGNEAVRAARAAIPKGTSRVAMDDELVAYLVEKHPELPIVKRIIAAIRAFLFRMGLIKNIRPEDVVALARAAARHAALEPGYDPANASPDIRYSRVSIPGDVFAPYADLEDLRRKVRAYARGEYAGKPKEATVQSTTERVIIPWQGVKHSVARASDEATLKAVVALPAIIENARHVKTEPDRHGRGNIKAIHEYEADVALGSDNYHIGIVIREHLDGKRFYDHVASAEKREPAGISGEHQAQRPDESLQPAAGSETTIGGNGGPVKGPQAPLYSRATAPPPTGRAGARLLGGTGRTPPSQGEEQKPAPDPNTPEGSAEQLGRIGEAMRSTRHGWDAIKSKMFEDWRPAWLGLFTRRQLVDIGQGMVPELATYDRAVQAMDADRNQFDDEAHDVAEVAAAFVRKDRKEADKLFDLMHRATLAGADPAERFRPSINPGEAYQEMASLRRRMRGRSGEADVLQARIDQIQIRLANEKVRKVAHPGLAKRYFGLTQEAKVVYARMRDLYKKRFDERESALIQRIRDAEANEQWKARLIADIRHRFETARLSAPYFPLTRFGDYWVACTNPHGEREYHLRESTHQQRALIQELTTAGYQQIAHGFKMDTLFEQQGASAGFVSNIIKLLDQGMRNSPGAAEIKDSIYQMYLQSLPELSARRHWIHREKTPGFSQDALRGFAKQMFHGNRQLAKLRHQTAMEKALTAARKGVRHADDPNRAAHLVNEMQRRDEWIKNPTTASWANFAGSIGFMWYLTAPASAIVNVTQTPLVAYPLLAARHGWGKSAAALNRAAGDFFRGRFSVEGALQGEELAAYKRFLADGVIDKTQVHDLAGMSETPSAIYSGRRAKAMRAASFLFHRAERANREITALAAFRLARAQGLGLEAAYEQAKGLTWEAHFDYSNSNKARFIQGDAARVLFMFKQFSQHMTYLLARSAQQSLKGLTPAVRREARLRLTGLLGMHALFAGALGMPLMGTLSVVMNSLFDDEDEPYDFDLEFRNFLAGTFGPDIGQAIARGPVESLTGLGISNRVGLSDLWIREPDKSLEGRGLVEWGIEQLLGPLGGIALKGGTAYELFQEGETRRALESMTPTAIRSGLQSLRYAEKGVQSLRGDPIMEDVSAWNLFTQAAGFAPAELGQRYDANRALKDLEQRILDRRERLIGRWWLARRHGDLEGVQEAMAAIGRFNGSSNIQKNPRARITPATLLASMQQRRNYSRRAEGGIIVDRRLARLEERVRFGQ